MSFRGLLGILLLLGVGALAWLLWVRFEGGAPEISGAPQDELQVGNAGHELEIAVSDAGSGVRSVRVGLEQGRDAHWLLEEGFPGSPWTGAADPAERRVTLRIDPKALGLEDGRATLSIHARDWSLRGNDTILELPVRVDRAPPRIGVSSGLTYVSRGGAGTVVYTVSETPVRSGVQVGDAFFRGHGLGGRYVAIFAVPVDGPPDPRVRVVAEDAAGNVAEAGWPAVVKERQFPKAEVSLPASFLDGVVRELVRATSASAEDPSAAFREINTRIRAENEQRIAEIVADTAGEPLWRGAFEQLENSKVTSRFAERRDYVVGGVTNSQATHFGYDLASTAAAPITATAAGRVLFADELGIYGNCVILDHGLGVSSLYGHLSRVDVAAGDRVEQGQTLGLSGATGLAGGDHLHFAILVGGSYVDPLEWWDAKWVETHVDSRIRPRVAGETRRP